MRHKYETRGIVLTRSPVGEMNAMVAIMTPDFGLVYAHAQGVRRSGAKLSAALVTLAESELTLVRGMEQWRVTGAVLKENWFLKIKDTTARSRAVRVCGLFLRLYAGEMNGSELFEIIRGFFEALAVLPEDSHEAVEVLAVLRLLATLGLDAGEIPGKMSEYTPSVLEDAIKNRADYIARINVGISASGL